MNDAYGTRALTHLSQSIMVLVSIRRTHSQFPIRPYLSLLVDCLEDTDAHVRDCARISVVELFTGPGVTDAARADLKKEMTKKGVRKTIMDSVLSKLLGTSVGSNPQSREGSENGDAITAKKEYIPPSLMLQGKRSRVPSQSSTPTTTVPSRSVSHSGPVKELSRPTSRASTATPPLVTAASSSDSAEIQTVFVS